MFANAKPPRVHRRHPIRLGGWAGLDWAALGWAGLGLAKDGRTHELSRIEFCFIFLANIYILMSQRGRNLGRAGLLKGAHPEMSRFRFLSLVLANIDNLCIYEVSKLWFLLFFVGFNSVW